MALRASCIHMNRKSWHRRKTQVPDEFRRTPGLVEAWKAFLWGLSCLPCRATSPESYLDLWCCPSGKGYPYSTSTSYLLQMCWDAGLLGHHQIRFQYLSQRNLRLVSLSDQDDSRYLAGSIGSSCFVSREAGHCVLRKVSRRDCLIYWHVSWPLDSSHASGS